MKWVFFVLLAANLGLAGYVYVNESSPNPDAQILMQQMNADQIQIVAKRPAPIPVPPAPPATRAPAVTPTAVLPEARVCLEWGDFAAADLPKVQAALDGLALGESVIRTEVSVPSGYWIYLPPRKSKAEMDKKIAELKTLGITEFSPITESGPWRYAVSLGMYRNEDGAKTKLDELQKKGVRSARVGERTQRDTQTAFVISNASAEQAEKLGALAADYSGAQLRAADCPPS